MRDPNLRFKYGKLAAKRLVGVGTLSAYASGKLPAPPTSVDVPNAQYPIDGNDRYGDCTIAGVAHLIAAWDAEVNEKDAVPSSATVVEEYLSITHGQDTGCNEQDVLELWRTDGLFGSKIAAYAPVDHTSIIEIHQGVAFYGGAYLGIQCPPSAQEQFAEGVPWTYEGQRTDDGHCIVALGYTPTALLCATWGGVAQVTYPFLAHYLDEAWCALPYQFIDAGHGPRIDLPSLRADLNGLAA